MPDADAGHITDGAEIYRRSFATIRAEADLTRFPNGVEPVVVRMIHACGQVDLAADIDFSPNVASAAEQALHSGAPILCDSAMVAAGITRRRLPADNRVMCLLDDPRVPQLAQAMKTTRSAAALTLWGDQLAGTVVAIGNAPTALFALLDLLTAGAGQPAAVLGIPVGFIGAAESKRALADFGTVEYLTVHGRRGGSAITAAAVNALATVDEVLETPVHDHAR